MPRLFTKKQNYPPQNPTEKAKKVVDNLAKISYNIKVKKYVCAKGRVYDGENLTCR